MKTATSLYGYKHDDAAKLKKIKRFENKTNHPFWGKHHDDKLNSWLVNQVQWTLCMV